MEKQEPPVAGEIRHVGVKKHRTEDALRKAHTEERARAVELQAIMDAMPIAMVISRDPECRYVVGNRGAYELLRLPPGTDLSKWALRVKSRPRCW